MASFKTRINQISQKKGKIIFANDYDISTQNLASKTVQNIKKFNKFLCGLKLNFHVLLPLSAKEISKFNIDGYKIHLTKIAGMLACLIS